MRRLAKLLPMAKSKAPPASAEPLLELDGHEREHAAECTVVTEAEGEWRLTGERIEKAAAMTNWDYYEAQARFQRVEVIGHLAATLGAALQRRHCRDRLGHAHLQAAVTRECRA